MVSILLGFWNYCCVRFLNLTPCLLQAGNYNGGSVSYPIVGDITNNIKGDSRFRGNIFTVLKLKPLPGIQWSCTLPDFEV